MKISGVTIQSGSSPTIVSNVALSSASWSLVSGVYEYTYTNTSILPTSFLEFTPNNASFLEVSVCQMLPTITVQAGSCIFYSNLPPQSDIIGELVII